MDNDRRLTRYAIDPGYAQYYEGRAFEPPRDTRYPGIAVWLLLKRRLEATGAQVATADSFADATDLSDVRLITHCWTDLSARLVKRGARPIVLVCGEVPTVAWKCYRLMPRLSSMFCHVFGYPGLARRISGRARFHETFDPNAKRTPPTDRWRDRSFIVAVNSNIKPTPVNLLELLRAVPSRLWSPLPVPLRPSVRRQLAGLLDRELSRELYSARYQLIRNFARVPGFDLYGRGWDNAGPLHQLASQEVLSCWRGPIEDKDDVVRRYRFALCVENCAFPGAISEKIFDGIFAGAIPVYLGAPDIERYVPPSTFVDIRRFSRFDELLLYLQTMDPLEAERMRAEGRDFVSSHRFDPFSQDEIAECLAAAALDAA